MGRICRGCHLINEHHKKKILPAAVFSALVPAGIPPERSLDAIKTRLYSRDEFVKHMEGCYGAHKLMEEWEKETSQES